MASRFGSAWGRLDLYGLFLEQSLRLLRNGGALSFITPDKWLTADSSRPLRALALARNRVRTLDRFERHDLFPGVSTVPCVTTIKAGERGNEATVRWWDVDDRGHPSPRSAGDRIELAVDGAPWYPPSAASGSTVLLGSLVERISVGIATGLNRAFILDEDGAAAIEPELLRPVIRGRDIGVEQVADAGRWLLLPYEFDDHDESARLVDLDSSYPGSPTHLEAHRAALEAWHCVRVWRKRWYDLHDPCSSISPRRTKIVFPDVAYDARFAVDAGRGIPLHSAYYMLPRADGPLSVEDILAKLRCAAVISELRRRAPTANSGYRRFRAQVLRQLPIPVDTRPATFSLLDAA